MKNTLHFAPRPLRLVAAIGIALSLASCFPHISTPDWWGPTTIASDDPLLKDAPAVYLKLEQTILMNTKTKTFSEIAEHGQIKVLTEAGIDAANFRILTKRGTELDEVNARVISADGKTREVKPEAINEETILVEGDTFTRTVFRVPNVTVGSTIEYYVKYYGEFYFRWYRSVVTRQIPIKTYTLNYQVSGGIIFEARAYNTTNQVKMTPDGRGSIVSLKQENIPAAVRQDFAPDGTLAYPWWVFSVKRLRNDRRAVTETWVNKDWNTALRDYGEELYLDHDDEYFDDFSPSIDVSGCEDVLCRIQRAKDYVTETLDLTWFKDYFESSPLPKVIERRHASNHEMNFLLYAALRSVGVDAELGVVNRYLTRGHDFSMPLALWFNHSVVFVTPQSGFERTLVVDASCEYCALGTLPWWSRDTKAAKVSSVAYATGGFAVDTAFYDLKGRVPMPPRMDRRTEMTLQKDGTASGTVVLTYDGASAEKTMQRVLDNSAAENTARGIETLKRVFRSGVVSAQEALTCERAKGHCQQSFTFEGTQVALRDGNKIVLPLDVLQSPYERTLDEATREHDIFITTNETYTDRVHIVLPRGYLLDQRPTPVKAESAAFTYTLNVESAPDGAIVVRRLTRRRGRYAKKDYEALRAPLRAFARADNVTLTVAPGKGRIDPEGR